MKRATEYHPTRLSHPVETLVEFLAGYPGVPINEEFWRKRIDDYVASVVVPPVSRSAFRVIRDEHGYAKAIAHGKQYVLQVNSGTVLNEHFIEQLVAMLKCTEQSCSECKRRIEISKRHWREKHCG
jgi:hypothetical protein